MQNTYKRGLERLKTFFKQNAALLIIIGCVLAITVIVIVSATGETPVVVDPNDPPQQNDPDEVVNPDPDDVKPDPEQPVDLEKKKFALPIKDYKGLGKEYTNDSDNLFVHYPAAGWFMTHRAVDFLAEEGTEVLAMRDGTVLEVGVTFGFGKHVIIDHGDGIVATYASLGDVRVKAGQLVEKGDVIGTVSNTAAYEEDDGPHLHLVIQLNDKPVNPWDYLLED